MSLVNIFSAISSALTSAGVEGQVKLPSMSEMWSLLFLKEGPLQENDIPVVPESSVHKDRERFLSPEQGHEPRTQRVLDLRGRSGREKFYDDGGRTGSRHQDYVNKHRS